MARQTLNSRRSYSLRISRKSSIFSTEDELEERLHEWLTFQQIEELREFFENSETGSLSYNQLREILSINLNIHFQDHQYHTLFLKLNQDKDFMCDWNEFVSHLIFGFQQDDPSLQKEALTTPINLPPIIKKSDHKGPIVCVTRMKDFEAQENDPKGTYITGSKEGQIKFWNPSLVVQRHEFADSYIFKKRTYILQVQALSDVGVLATSSADWELRFYDVANFNLRIIIRTMPFTVYSMTYSCDPNSTSKLVLGDYDGNIRILEFSTYLRGPFQSKPGTAMVFLTWADIMKGKYPAFKPKEFLGTHKTIITHSYYSIKFDWIFSSAEYRDIKKFRKSPGFVNYDINYHNKIAFNIPLGVTHFCVDEVNRIVATGGPDTFVRLWDPVVNNKPTALLTGHHGGIVLIFIQPEEKKLYSLDYLKVLKVWHLTEHYMLQSYGDLTRHFQYESRLAYFYNQDCRELIVAGRIVVAIKCCAKLRLDLSDGNTHSAPVSVVLYNKLFKNVVTCGLDSYIIVWDPFTGKRQLLMKNCHTRVIYGENVDIEITAACFNSMAQFLLTGARDGSVKIWNYNNATCIRNMNIENLCEITAVNWVEDRILVAGWNKHVAEFADVEGQEYADAKNWPTFHDEDITCADVKFGEGVVTATYSGELIFWKLETGQPYRQYKVNTPNTFLDLRKTEQDQETEKEEKRSIRISKLVRKSVSQRAWKDPDQGRPSFLSLSRKSKASLTSVQDFGGEPPLSVQAVLFMQTRPMTKEHGSLLVALDTGVIQCYSHHKLGGFIKEFSAIHKTGDCIQCMTTDKKNHYLFTGTAFGYVKIWLLTNFCVPTVDHVRINKPLLRLQFTFLQYDLFIGRAKRIANKEKNGPMLLSSYKAHMRAINSIEFIYTCKFVLTGSHDCSCRLWSLSGKYLGTLGSPLPWLRLREYEIIDDSDTYRVPPDIKRSASSTTLKVLTGELCRRLKTLIAEKPTKVVAPVEEDDVEVNIEDKVTCKEPSEFPEPLLGFNFKLPPRQEKKKRISYKLTNDEGEVTVVEDDDDEDE